MVWKFQPCATHGPVWRKRIAEVVSLYDKLSRYEPLDNGVTIVYGSMYGNTEQMAEAAARELAAQGIKEIAMFNASVTNLSYLLTELFTHRGLVVAAPTYSDTLFPPVATFLEAMATRGVKNREVMIIGSHTWSQQATKRMAATLEACKIAAVAEPVSLKHAPDSSDFENCREAARALASALHTIAQEGLTNDN